MTNLIKRIKEKYVYSLESIKNRYPCKIVDVNHAVTFDVPCSVVYQAVSKINLREQTPEMIMRDPLLVEKFHPTDCIKLGFLAAGEILLKEAEDLDEAKSIYKKIMTVMFEDIMEDAIHDPK